MKNQDSSNEPANAERSTTSPVSQVDGSQDVQAPLAQIDSNPAGYVELLETLRERVGTARVRAGLAINRGLVLLNWYIGRDILTRQDQGGWGAKVIDRLSDDLRNTFPKMKGFSTRNLKYMRSFAAAYQD